MIRIRHSPESGLDLEGTREELQAIRKAILAVSSGTLQAGTFAAEATGSPAPYAAWLDRMVVSLCNGPTRIAVVGDSEVRVVGNRECLRGLASYFDVPRGAEDGWNTHHEHQEGDRWVERESQPMTVSLRRPTTA